MPNPSRSQTALATIRVLSKRLLTNGTLWLASVWVAAAAVDVGADTDATLHAQHMPTVQDLGQVPAGALNSPH